MTNKIYEIIKDGKTLRKYQVSRLGVLQGWLWGESPEAIGRLYNWKLEDCVFEPQALSCWDLAGADVVK